MDDDCKHYRVLMVLGLTIENQLEKKEIIVETINCQLAPGKIQHKLIMIREKPVEFEWKIGVKN